VDNTIRQDLQQRTPGISNLTGRQQARALTACLVRHDNQLRAREPLIMVLPGCWKGAKWRKSASEAPPLTAEISSSPGVPVRAGSS
jgi:hypothetical protein